MIDLISGEDLAKRLRFDGTTSAFRKFCHDTGIRSVPGRKDCYDPVAVRKRLDLVQGLVRVDAGGNDGLIEQSRARRSA
ncbi:hypothetical protein C8N36_10334 [Pelagimonas varians]|uniref:Uncharacterized protein n=1 Tax=Pelagimonas varians TaxID=696760 RepID=A0A238KGR2_9RHOB|nr:hypothetical protein C8N36_10334 [Pelagimonas varians]SMX42003.1 hypothetical protein PEV8663_02396 [Pelagimonas varians]